MYDFLEDYTDSPYYVKEKNAKVLSSDEATRQSIAEGSTSEGFNDFVFTVNEIEDKYYLSEKVAKYVLCPGTKTFKTPIKTDLDIARPLLQSMHKMHRAGVDNYVTYNKKKGN